MGELILFAFFGTVAGAIVGLIPTLGPLVAVSLCYHFLLATTPINIMSFYVSLLVAANYMNGVTAVIYGIPGDATSIPTAQMGHRLYRRGFGSQVIGSNALSSTIGVIFSTAIFIVFSPNIFDFFKFYNSIVLTAVMMLVITGILISNGRRWHKTLLYIVFGGVLAKIGVDDVTLATFLTFNNQYLNLGVPFMSIMIGLYVVPEFLKNIKINFDSGYKKTKMQILPGTFTASMLGSVVGFWCGLVPGVTNILGSYASALLTKKLFNNKPSMVVSAAESANNSGALSSLLPLLILAIPITGSEFLIYYAMLEQGFSFDAVSIRQFSNVLYIIPASAIISMFVAWRWYKILTFVLTFYSKKRKVVNMVFLLFIATETILTAPVPIWSLMSISILSAIGYFLKGDDTTPIVYGFFLTHTFFENFQRAAIILFT